MSKKKNRVGQQEKQHRLETLCSLSAQGHSNGKLVRMAIQQWHLSERQAYRYLEEVREIQRVLLDGDPLEQYGLLMASGHEIYRQAIQNNESDTAIRALKLKFDLVKETQKYKKPEALNEKPELSENLEKQLRRYLPKDER